MYARPLVPVLDAAVLRSLEAGTHADPFAILGPHLGSAGRYVRAFLPGAHCVDVCSRIDNVRLATLPQDQMPGLFAGLVPGEEDYFFRIHWPDTIADTEDPYTFGPLLGDLDLHLIGEGRHLDLPGCLGSQLVSVDGIAGVRFAVWAPDAHRVAVVGDFNGWDERRHPMRRRYPSGIWELFIPRLGPGERYKYALQDAAGHRLPHKADPLARATELLPGTASVVAPADAYVWSDADWIAGRAAHQDLTAPLSIYEVHLESWLRPRGQTISWQTAIEQLIPYVQRLGFTHIELLPIAEFPFGGSWGYQPTSLFAPTRRYGEPADFARFVDACHAAGIGVIVDWVPAHFPDDPHGLRQFDGSSLYEYSDAREGFHRDWNTWIYNFGRHEVRGFLIASAIYWIETFHVDGLRVDAVSSMLYRDYSRPSGEWLPNANGGRENLEAVEFLRQLNIAVAGRCPGALMIAEESTSWPGATQPAQSGGLGFSLKWNMGWMHDTLRYFARDPVHRRYHHDEMTFGMLYAYSERFVLPLSHDEVVHGKKSLLAKMPGDEWRKLANLRAFYGLMWAWPGRKLLFMGGELGQETEWNHNDQLAWHLLDRSDHAGLLLLIRDLNRLYREIDALHEWDDRPEGFGWSIVDDRDNSVLAFRRAASGGRRSVLVVANMTPLPRENYRVPAPFAGVWREVLNTDAAIYGGSNVGNLGQAVARPSERDGSSAELILTLPPLATTWFLHDNAVAELQ